MARTGVTYEEVEIIANGLVEEGVNPTIDRVRLELGTGSNSTIAGHLRAWKTKRIHSTSHSVDTKRAGLPDTLHNMVAQLWEKIRFESEAENEHIKQDAQEAIAQAQKLQLEADQKAEQLEASLEKAELKINHLDIDGQSKQTELIKSQKQNAVFEVKLKQSELDLKRFQEEAEKHVKGLEHNYQEIISYLKIQLEESKKYARQETDQLRKLLENQRQKFTLENEQLKTVKEKTDTLLAKLESGLKNEIAQKKATREEARGLTLDLKQITHQFNERELLVSSLKTEVINKNHQVDDLKQQVFTLQEKLENAIETIGSLKSKKQREPRRSKREKEPAG